MKKGCLESVYPSEISLLFLGFSQTLSLCSMLLFLWWKKIVYHDDTVVTSVNVRPSICSFQRRMHFIEREKVSSVCRPIFISLVSCVCL